MWAKILLFLVSVLCLAGCETSNQRSENGCESFGYELLVYEMEDLRSFLLDRLKSLGETIARDQKATDNRIVDITASVSTLKEQSKQILRNQFNLVLDSCSKANVPGVYRLQVPSINVLCEPTIQGGGWLVIQERSNGGTDFDRSWYDYRTGFGTVAPSSDFWLGLEAIHQITSNGQYELRVDVRNESKELKKAYYSQFKVAGGSDGYRLTVGGYSGTAIDGLRAHNNQKFSTYDKDNDKDDNQNCARDFESGWWFSNCRNSNLNGPFKKGSKGYGIEWGSFADAGTYSRMMIRRKP